MSKVLIVDDDKTTVQLLQLLLQLEGFETQAVARGSEVLNAVDRFQPHLLLMDYHLADMDSIVVLRQLRQIEHYQKLPIVIASGLDVEREVLQAGANRFLVKPFEPNELSKLFKVLIAEVN